METITVDDRKLEAVRVETSHANILMIKSSKGFLGCGYFDVETANKLEEPVAIVTGVKSIEDMLEAKVIKLSKAAESMGLSLGISGKEALSLLNSRPVAKVKLEQKQV